MSSNIKRVLLQVCIDHIEKRIKTIESQLNLIEESRNNETKSSAGDKYETGRAMMQMEENKARAQLMEAGAIQNRLSRIDPDKKHTQAGIGSLVMTNNGAYYIAAGIGKVNIEGDLYYCISIESPIGVLLKGRKSGDSVEFRTKKITIKDVS